MSDIKSAIQLEVANVFNHLSSIASKDLTYRVPVTASRDPETYHVVQTFKEYIFSGIVQAFTQKEIKAAFGTIGIHDKKILVSRKGLAFNFSVNGLIVIDGAVYPIFEVQADPAQAIYTIHVKG